MTGRVLDKETMQPVEGAYVVAIYRTQRAGVAAVTSHCTKSRGMITGKDGKYSFPVEKRDGYSPFAAHAIHVDYQSGIEMNKPEHIRIKQNAEAYSDRDILVARQQLGEKFSAGGTGEVSDCIYATNPQDAAAATEFLRIERAQYIKYAPSHGVIKILDRQIKRLETLDGRMPDEIREEPVAPPSSPAVKQ